MSKVRVNISLSPETHQRLKEYASSKHSTVSQVITDWIWNLDIEEGDSNDSK